MNIVVWFSLAALYVTGVAECLECFSCQNITDPNDCRATTQCSIGQSCFLQTVHDNTDLVILYNMGCQTNQQCSSTAVNPNGIIGRSISTRQQYSCHECCSTNNCNAQMCIHGKPSECKDDETLDCARLSSLFNMCADVHHAKITCPKFCGLCQLVDGNWADWSVWSACTVTCENGTQTRTRSCTNPAPSNGGLTCSGSAVVSKVCTMQLCPVHGNWTGWSVWSGCSVSCDIGLRKRSRTCTNPKPDRFGDYCVGDPNEYAVCQNQPCVSPVNGNWSDWSAWTSCSVSCDVGVRKRSRTCHNPQANAYGKDCVGDDLEYTVCLNDPCGARNGGWSSWGSWQSCSVTCGVGLKLRDRTCTNPSPSAYGKDCLGNSESFAVCINTPCTVVMFNAHGLNVLSNKVNVFSTVISNEGNAYNPNTGHFTAPVTGIYYFTVQICSAPGHSVVFYIDKGGASKSGATHVSATYQDHDTKYSCTSSSTSVKLARNEHVWVLMAYQYDSSSISEASDSWNIFTGTLIQEI